MKLSEKLGKELSAIIRNYTVHMLEDEGMLDSRSDAEHALIKDVLDCCSMWSIIVHREIVENGDYRVDKIHSAYRDMVENNKMPDGFFERDNGGVIGGAN